EPCADQVGVVDDLGVEGLGQGDGPVLQEPVVAQDAVDQLLGQGGGEALNLGDRLLHPTGPQVEVAVEPPQVRLAEGHGLQGVLVQLADVVQEDGGDDQVLVHVLGVEGGQGPGDPDHLQDVL